MAVRIVVAGLAFFAALTGAGATTAMAGPKYKLLRLDGRIVKWGEPRLGAPAHITYAFATGPFSDVEARNCKRIERLDDVARRNGLAVADIERQAEAAFGLWHAVAGVSFSRIANPERADIVIGAQGTPRGYAFANVRYRQDGQDAARPASDRGMNVGTAKEDVQAEMGRGPVVAIEKSAICLNPERAWKIGTHDGRDGYDLRFTFTHEIGHAIGLDHYARPGEIMHFKYSEQIAGPQPGDIAGIRRLYGAPVQAAK
ncbi:matrixin [Breoghania corrubedonensis]|uniref:Matrixin n=1 Tax=Breoghania corrubedonensis TaxID=665038 RepID=A0A2T5VB46_9HYPH|nr:matrixin family metalloprotease [Breoghania corrubedonensis]PTW60967.1 matrixin [Breoghania corrubedonensis]